MRYLKHDLSITPTRPLSRLLQGKVALDVEEWFSQPNNNWLKEQYVLLSLLKLLSTLKISDVAQKMFQLC